jgi:hypothetical protein
MDTDDETEFLRRWTTEASSDTETVFWQDLRQRVIKKTTGEYRGSPIDLYVQDVIRMKADQIARELLSRQPGTIDLRAFLDAAGRQNANVLAGMPAHAWPVVTMTLHGNSDYDLPLFQHNEGMRQCTRFWLQECNVQGLTFLYGYA